MEKKIGLTFDLKTDWKPEALDPNDINAEWDPPEVIDRVVRALEAGGHSVQRIGNVQNLLSEINNLDVDIIMNLCEGVFGRNRESQVPMLLEMHNIPYIGADALTLGMTLDKFIAKKIFDAENIPTPRYFIAEENDDVEQLNTIGYPLIVKTRHEGTSKGIHKDARVENLGQLKARVQYINETYHQAALVEEFISGTEFTIAVIGNDPPEAMPVVQISIDGKLDLQDAFYSNERVYDNSVKYICPAEISDELAKKLQALAIQVYKAVDCLDLGRVDFRVDKNGNIYVLEINPLPSLSEEDVFEFFPKVIDSTYDETINRIVDFALKRYKIGEPSIVT